MNENSGDLDSVTGKIALSVTQHRPPRRELLDAQPTTSAEHDLVSVFGILWHHMDFRRKAFSLPRLWSKHWSKKKKEKPDSAGLQRERGGLGHGYSAVLSTNDTSAQEQTKENCRTKTESGSTAAANRMWRHFFYEKEKKSFSVPRVGFKCKPCVSETELRRDGL